MCPGPACARAVFAAAPSERNHHLGYDSTGARSIPVVRGKQREGRTTVTASRALHLRSRVLRGKPPLTWRSLRTQGPGRSFDLGAQRDDHLQGPMPRAVHPPPVTPR